ncbi:hypothetical protein [Pedobacter sp. SL55]|uniref:FEKKY domain-containing protein n=1 Tax=Pedobacter sp. SL55 TaxID=2995161 RepID=UPI0022704934|nr:hypothetical protein [Pedobacter sp. SL55]WAC42560.1 hypothetical protein OVA16_09460 [Pedobacter sp. SL55]
MKIYLIFAAMVCCLSCQSPSRPKLPKQIEKEMLTYYTYGEIPPAPYIYYDTTFNLPQYSLKIKNMGGCEPIGVDYDKLELHNSKTAAYLSKKFGKNWDKDFETQTKQKIMVPIPLAN